MKKTAARKTTPAEAPRPIGVFDSGIGGLTVVAALRKLLPAESIFYIGDTARVPYGGKSQATIERYSQELSGLLLAERAKLIVVACNTASALGVPRLRETLRIPVTGVIEPGAQAGNTCQSQSATNFQCPRSGRPWSGQNGCREHA